MRVLFCLALLLPGAALGDTILATSRVTAVTVYPDGAQVTREVVFTAGAGSHDVLITDLPGSTDANLLRVVSPDTDLGSFALREDRLPPRDDAVSAEMQAGKDAVKVARVALQGAEAKVAGIKAEVEAQDAQIKFLTGVKADCTVTADSLSAVSQMIRTEVLTARMAALAAAASLPDAEEALTKAQDELSKAEAAVDALAQRDADYQALSVTVAAKGGEGHLVLTHFVSEAGWGPVYDITLDRKAGKLALKRGVLVGQYSGEDWAGVDLTLSTARPSSRSQPAVLWPYLRRIEDPVPAEDMAQTDGQGGIMEPVMIPESVAAATSAVANYQGDTVVYHYPDPVDLATDVEALRLKLDELSFVPEVFALAVPRYEETAFLMAKLTNDSADILLPGTAYLYRDGAMVGQTQLEALAPGAETDLGFWRHRRHPPDPRHAAAGRGRPRHHHHLDPDRGKGGAGGREPDGRGLGAAGVGSGALFGAGGVGDHLYRRTAGQRGRCRWQAGRAGLGHGPWAGGKDGHHAEKRDVMAGGQGAAIDFHACNGCLSVLNQYVAG